MIKILITGFSGFVARHLIDSLVLNNDSYSVLGVDVNKPEFSLGNSEKVSIEFKQCNLLEKKGLEEIFLSFI